MLLHLCNVSKALLPGLKRAVESSASFGLKNSSPLLLVVAVFYDDD